MEYICNKPKNSCNNCIHYRHNEDYNDKACFAEQDQKKKLKLIVHDIKWDTDGEEIEDLSDTIEISENDVETEELIEMYEGISDGSDDLTDYLSDNYGWCIFSIGEVEAVFENC